MREKMITFENGQMTMKFLPTGDLYEIRHGAIMVNQVMGNMLDGSMNQIFLRVHTDTGIMAQPLLGVQSTSVFAQGAHSLMWEGEFAGVQYIVRFVLAATNHWFFEVTVEGDQMVDLLYGQDVGLADKGAVMANEAYTSQYVDHHVSNAAGYVVASRQNMPQGGKFPYVQHGSLSDVIAYSVDGYQFFGTDYKVTNVPQALQMEQLSSEVYQYEMAYVGLQSAPFHAGQRQTRVFYGSFLEDHATAVHAPYFEQEVLQSHYDEALNLLETDTHTALPAAPTIGKAVLTGQPFSEGELAIFFPQQVAVERDDVGQLLSFFTKEKHHVILPEKERQMERPHGHIVLAGTDLSVDQPLMGSTSFMYGVFQSQVVLGNTTMNKLMSNCRNSLNVMKKSGQRIYVKQGAQWQLLTMPSAYEIGFNVAKWYYKLADDVLTVTVFTGTSGRQIELVVESQANQAYDFLVSNHVLMNSAEDMCGFQQKRTGQVVTFTSDAASAVAQEYPELTYHLHVNVPYEVVPEATLIGSCEGMPESLVFIAVEQQSTVQLTIQGTLKGAAYEACPRDMATEVAAYESHISNLIQGFKLESDNKAVQPEVERMTILAHWYTHNMLVHYLSPHGLEQYGGAAWGTRDVSQGPVEFFLATNNTAIVREIILKIYSNQFSDDGNWPQWFMFDRYEKIKADESHGDVIVWPLKVVGDYLRQTGDYSVLAEVVPYTDRESFAKKDQKVSILDHVKKQVATIERQFLPGTFLSSYGDGDWDDTLQPYDATLRKNMVSSWTIALTHQTLAQASEVLACVDAEYAAHLGYLVQGIKTDLHKHLLQTAVIPGFGLLNESKTFDYIIHPRDNRTGIQYRLLPMTRCMIAEIFTPEEAEAHYALINEHLKFPDGVRLMNRPATYQGGTCQYFKRAEQAANFGREIGLQYVHAHIRFVEAMAKLGKKGETWHALHVINPIGIQEKVKNAQLRQSNAYFSSSDGAFKTRYEAQENFAKLRNGSIMVKGGWRIYSSGPGIFLNQLISNVLGVRQGKETVTIDPVLPPELNGTTLTYTLLGKPVVIRYEAATDEPQLMFNGQPVSHTCEPNRYRRGGLVVTHDELTPLLRDENELVIYY